MGYTTTKDILEGQVKITARGRTAKVASAIHAFMAVVPDHDKLPDMVRGHFLNCAYSIPATEAVEFNLNGHSPPALYAWKEFWDKHAGSTDYAAVWEAYQEYIPITVGNAWFEGTDAANEVDLLAPEPLRKDPKDLDPKNG